MGLFSRRNVERLPKLLEIISALLRAGKPRNTGESKDSSSQ